ncbi:MAG: hypothetical protein GHCLOJNM_03325 [bacterium]|nr:hypothetical protein [bacterium]
MPKHALVLTVGVGGADPDSLCGALKKSISNAHPEVLGLVLSTGSRPLALRLKDSMKDSCAVEELEVSDPDDADKTFAEILSFIRKLIRENQCDPDWFQVDFTSGTKAMSAAAVMAAVAAGVRELRYVSGERKSGVVQKGMERILTLSPVRVLAQSRLREAIDHLRHLRYGACLATLEPIPEQALPLEDREIATGLSELAQAYQAWDLFRHREACETLKKCSKSVWEDPTGALKPFLIPRERLGILERIAKDLLEDDKHRPLYSEDVRADLWNNALRRVLEGKYDDAVARLYRLTEMCSQAALQARGIDTANVPEDQVPQEHRSKYDFRPVRGRREASIPLQKGFELLRDLGDPIGELVQPRSRIGQMLGERNKSILAHGTAPISKKACLGLAKEVRGLLKELDPKLEQRAGDIQFPWINPVDFID